MKDKKFEEIKNILQKQDEKKSNVGIFLRRFWLANMIAFLSGSFAWFASKGETVYDDKDGEMTGRKGDVIMYDASPFYHIYGDMSYTQAIKNAYAFEDLRNNKGGTFQAICGLMSVLLALGYGIAGTRKKTKEHKLWERSKEKLHLIEELKIYGINANKLLTELSDINLQILEKMSEMDRDYLNNLLSGGLSGANSDIVNAIISGALRSHPEDYDKILQVIDNNTIPFEIMKKYGDKTVSFYMASVMAEKKEK